jgi:hypothetical protein
MLTRQEWDFSTLPKNELKAALAWEVIRECPDSREIVTKAKLWLEGKLSTRKPPISPELRKRWKGRNPRSSQAEIAEIQASSLFDEFIPIQDLCLLHHWTLARRRREYDKWHATQLRPLVTYFDLPWLRIPPAERQRLAAIGEASRNANVVRIGSWWDAVGHFRNQRIDPGLPLRFEYSEYTTVLLTINRRFTKKRILAAIANILATPPNTEVVKWNARGRKNRDLFVALERIGIMRLLHHYTLSELRLKLPEAYKMYDRRNWYDERRRALKAIRRFSHYAEPEKLTPVSWLTKAQKSRGVSAKSLLFAQ